jgi:hypothetical protein
MVGDLAGLRLADAPELEASLEALDQLAGLVVGGGKHGAVARQLVEEGEQEFLRLRTDAVSLVKDKDSPVREHGADEEIGMPAAHGIGGDVGAVDDLDAELAARQLAGKHLGEGGKNINTDIGNLVKKGLPIQIQQSLDIVRVTGNNAVHPGEMQLEEDSQSVSLLFQLVNLIVENQISQPKAVQELYSKLPQGTLDAINTRDGNANKTKA